MSGERLLAESDHAIPLDAILKDGVRGKPDVAAIASLDGSKLCVLLWHYHDDDLPGPPADVELRVTGLPFAARVARQTHFRIDEERSNSFTAWKRLGSPQSPTAEQYALLEKAGQLDALIDQEPIDVSVNTAKLRIELPRQAVSLVVLDWSAR
jgi:xylan 1,4-beta-xylosidase